MATLLSTLVHKQRSTKLAACAAIFFSMSACNQSEETAPYVYESGAFVYDAPIYWLDDKAIVFYSIENLQKPKNAKEQEELATGIYIWNIETDSIEKYANSRNLVCFQDGYIVYMRAGGVRVEGPLGNEAPRLSVEGGPHMFNKRTCKLEPRPAHLVGRIVIPLKEGDGYLDFGKASHGSETMDREATLVMSGGTRAKTTFPRWGAVSLDYYPFNDSYFGQSSQFTQMKEWNSTNCFPTWWLQRDGRTEKRCIPYGPWSRFEGRVKVVPTLRGLFVSSAGFVGKTTEGSGGYLLNSEGGRKLFKGLILHESVSPDGCKVAFVSMDNPAGGRLGWPGIRTVQYVNVCEIPGLK